MNKTFLVSIGDEITSEDDLEEINVGKLFSLIYRGTGFRECEIGVKEISEEQTCGTPDESMKKALDLLTRASDSLNYYCTELNGDMNDGLAMEIEEYIRDNTKGRTK